VAGWTVATVDDALSKSKREIYLELLGERGLKPHRGGRDEDKLHVWADEEQARAFSKALEERAGGTWIVLRA
jgi:hypothetical protein